MAIHHGCDGCIAADCWPEPHHTLNLLGAKVAGGAEVRGAPMGLSYAAAATAPRWAADTG